MSKKDAPAAEARSLLCTDATTENFQYVSVNLSQYQSLLQLNSLYYKKLKCRPEKNFSVFISYILATGLSGRNSKYEQQEQSQTAAQSVSVCFSKKFSKIQSAGVYFLRSAVSTKRLCCSSG